MNLKGLVIILVHLLLIGAGVWYAQKDADSHKPTPKVQPKPSLPYRPYLANRFGTSGLYAVLGTMKRWSSSASLKEIRDIWDDAGYKAAREIDSTHSQMSPSGPQE